MFLGYNVNVFIFVHIDADDDFQVPDWHVGQCQSGTWKTSGSLNGSYTNLGSHRGS
ncbi:prepilin, shufflon protein A, partial [Escherichia coli]